MNTPSPPKIAIFYDWLNQWGGAERLLLDILAVFPKAQLFTSVYDPTKTSWLPKNTSVHISPLNKSFIFKKNTVLSGIMQPIALEHFNFNEFDIVISLTSLQGKCLLTTPKTLHLCYCLTPNRYLYQKKYFPLIQKLINYYKKIDYIYAKRPDYYFAISQTVQRRIKNHYQRQSQIIYPGVDTTLFKPIKNPTNDYFLTVARLVPHKNIDLAILACIQTNNHLKIVNTGPQLNYLKKIANSNPLIEFIGPTSQEKLITLYQNCAGLICPQNEDFGLAALEAQAAGRPVIALNKGGIAEIVIDGQTGLLFPEQSLTSLIQTLKIFPKNIFTSQNCRQRALLFSRQKFMVDFESRVLDLWKKHQATITI